MTQRKKEEKKKEKRHTGRKEKAEIKIIRHPPNQGPRAAHLLPVRQVFGHR
jgi:hypothetical protein